MRSAIESREMIQLRRSTTCLLVVELKQLHQSGTESNWQLKLFPGHPKSKHPEQINSRSASHVQLLFSLDHYTVKASRPMFNFCSDTCCGLFTLRNCQVTDTKPCFLAPKMGSLLAPSTGARMAGPPPKNSWDCQFPTTPLTQRINDIPITLRTIPAMVKKTHPTQICTDGALNEQLPSKKKLLHTFLFVAFF